MIADVCPKCGSAEHDYMPPPCKGLHYHPWHDQPAPNEQQARRDALEAATDKPTLAPNNKAASVGMMFEFTGILKGIRGALDTANGLVIVDTLWYSNAETLRDFISNEIERYEKAMLAASKVDA